MADLTEELLKIIERELTEVWDRSEVLCHEDIQSRTHDLLSKLRAQLDDRIVWLIYENSGDSEPVFIASTEAKASEWLRNNTTAAERAAYGFGRKYSITAHQVDA